MTPVKKKTASAAKESSAAKASVSLSMELSTNFPDWRNWGVHRAVQVLLLFFAATLPLYYDLSVPEVSGDIRWAATEFFAGLCALLLLGGAVLRGQGTLKLRWPVVMWVALGLAFWAALSLVDALNWTRGVVLIKALYAQLILMVVVYHVATPDFGRKLLWAMVLPLAFTSILGMWQFQDMSDARLREIMDASWVFMWFKPLVWMLNGIAGSIADWIGWGQRDLGIVGLMKGYFLQSAVPGSTFANKNLAGSWTAMMLPVALYLLLTAKRWPAQAVASVLLGLGSVFLIYSRARASWVALFAALLTLATLVVLVPAWRRAVWRHLDFSHLWWLLVPVIMVAHWRNDVSPVEGSYAVDRTPAEQVAALAGSSWNEIGGRLAYNLNSTQIVKDYWFNGVGLGSFYTIYPPYYNAVVVTPTNSYNVMARPQRTHTDMMQAFDELGIIGGLLYAGLFVTGIAMALRLAGRRAGALGGYIVGAGMLSMVLALAVFLEHQSMLWLPTPWNIVFYGGMLTAIGVMVAGGIWNWRKVYSRGDLPLIAAYGAGLAWMGYEGLVATGMLDLPEVAVWGVRILLGGSAAVLGYRAYQVHEKAPERTAAQAADDVRLMGFMAGIGLLCISINALMDFPMQLPTAPASAALLLGVIVSVYARHTPETYVGPKAELRTGRAGAAALFALVAVAWVVGMWDAYKFREGNIYLKAGMVRIFSGVNDETTLAVLEKAYEIYPYDQRILEHMGVAYANYNGVTPIPLDLKIAKMEWVLASDPWGANHLINLAGAYLQKAEISGQQGDLATKQLYLGKAEELFGKLQRVADFSHFTWGIGGMIRMLEGRDEDARWMFQRALSIEPNYAPAQVGMQMIVSRTGVKPVTVQDGMMGVGK